MYNLSPTTGSNILGNQLMQKFWLVTSNIQYQEILLSEIVEVHLKWGYQRSTTGTLLYGSLTHLSRSYYLKW
jgi:hypothetical protein